jgi:hypothetical protein
MYHPRKTIDGVRANMQAWFDGERWPEFVRKLRRDTYDGMDDEVDGFLSERIREIGEDWENVGARNAIFVTVQNDTK